MAPTGGPGQGPILPSGGDAVQTRRTASAFPRVGGSVLVGGGGAAGEGRRLLDLEQELEVALGLAQLAEEQLDGLLLVEGVEHPAQLPDGLELVRRHEDLLLAGAGGVDVDRGEDALVREL